MNEGAVNEHQTLSHFLLSLYDGLQSAKQVFNEIGIRKISPTQITCLSELPLSSLYFCLKMFAAWMEEGMYDFSTLPYTIKAHLSQQDRDTLKAIPQNWDGKHIFLFSISLSCIFMYFPVFLILVFFILICMSLCPSHF